MDYANFPKNFSIINDFNRIKQIMINFIGNAIKFTYKGYIKVILQLHEKAEDLIIVSIKDSGIGMNSQTRACLGQLFENIDEKSIDKRVKGSPSPSLPFPPARALMHRRAGPQTHAEIDIRMQAFALRQVFALRQAAR